MAILHGTGEEIIRFSSSSMFFPDLCLVQIVFEKICISRGLCNENVRPTSEVKPSLAKLVPAWVIGGPISQQFLWR